eukprot:CAMPEP_0194278730 /NCGR_PEP_ID=MMETSP0169-20130528/11947_1 /TAXON_ID=218684 /ORGANISM="Corethron pennatum, Strain L29A3" /LENGTH=454 /DNA_ID=CAMNT_0039022987 /DNA_START=70 /DNA_END=1434 /DNA_ORIENTATION=+
MKFAPTVVVLLYSTSISDAFSVAGRRGRVLRLSSSFLDSLSKSPADEEISGRASGATSYLESLVSVNTDPSVTFSGGYLETLVPATATISVTSSGGYLDALTPAIGTVPEAVIPAEEVLADDPVNESNEEHETTTAETEEVEDTDPPVISSGGYLETLVPATATVSEAAVPRITSSGGYLDTLTSATGTVSDVVVPAAEPVAMAAENLVGEPNVEAETTTAEPEEVEESKEKMVPEEAAVNEEEGIADESEPKQKDEKQATIAVVMEPERVPNRSVTSLAMNVEPAKPISVLMKVNDADLVGIAADSVVDTAKGTFATALFTLKTLVDAFTQETVVEKTTSALKKSGAALKSIPKVAESVQKSSKSSDDIMMKLSAITSDEELSDLADLTGESLGDVGSAGSEFAKSIRDSPAMEQVSFNAQTTIQSLLTASNAAVVLTMRRFSEIKESIEKNN